jgi:hypothetical protein
VPFRHEDGNDQADQSDDQHHGEGDGEGSSLRELTATRTEPTGAVPSEELRLATDSRGHAHDRRAISRPLTPAKTGFSWSLADRPSCRSSRIEARTAQIPKLIVRVRFPSPAPTKGS